jgi:hypothetical protein
MLDEVGDVRCLVSREDHHRSGFLVALGHDAAKGDVAGRIGASGRSFLERQRDQPALMTAAEPVGESNPVAAIDDSLAHEPNIGLHLRRGGDWPHGGA